jgi:CPA2 family monovalent cation:H+ antiporter-2
MDQSILDAIIILLMGSVITVAVFRRLQLPSILAYLLVGVVIGPHGLAWVPHTEDTHFLAEFGVVFLLFTIGLEFSLARLNAMKKDVLGLGGAQVLVTTVLAGAIALLLGLPLPSAVVVGGVLAMSSTAIVIKQLKDQHELGLLHGRQSVGILLFQDVAVVPFLILIPVLAENPEAALVWELLQALGKGMVVIAVMLAIGWWILRPLFRVIVAYHSTELFTLTALLFAMASAWLSHFAGLSFALGAFLAGIILGETEFRHQIEADIRPFRDVLLGLFFITIGMMFDIHVLSGMAHWVLLLAAALVLTKMVVIAGLCLLFDTPAASALRTGVILAQGGEFGLVLLAIAFSNGLLDTNTVQLVLAASIVSMALTPVLIKYNGVISRSLSTDVFSRSVEKPAKQETVAAADLAGHVIICGYGTTGRGLAQLLQEQGFDYAGLDLNVALVREARSNGENVLYGDASHPGILGAAGLRQARALVITYADEHVAETTIKQVRSASLNLPILVSAHNYAIAEHLLISGATDVVTRDTAANLMFEVNLLNLLEVPLDDIAERMRKTCAAHYPMLDNIFGD